MSKLARLAQFHVATRWDGRVPAYAVELCFGAACAGAFVIARLTVNLFAPTAGPFALIYPFTLIATLFSTWRAGVVTYAGTFAWTWCFARPDSVLFHVMQPTDASRILVNGISALVVLVLADLFRSAVRRAVDERDQAIGKLEARELALRELNDGLEKQIADRTRELGQTWAVSPDLLAVIDKDGHFEASNPAWQTALGWSVADMRTTKFMNFVHPDDLDRTRAAWVQINRGIPVLRFENRYKRRGGGWKWLSWVVVPEGDKFYGSARDITEEKDQQTSLAAAEDALRQSQKLEALGQLTGGVAHDFNNLLTVIIGSVGLLRKENLSEEKRNRYVEAIGSTADRAAKLTGQLLAFARRQSLDPVIFNVGDSLLDVLGIIQTLSGSHIDIDNQTPPEDYFVTADKGQFDAAIVNMCINARDAMGGHGRLTISARVISDIPGSRSYPALAGEFVAVKIDDTGTGIADDVADRIFEPFFTTKSAGAGTGLGLSQVFGFAKQSGGDIRVASVKGSGSTFTLYLPRARPSPVPH